MQEGEPIGGWTTELRQAIQKRTEKFGEGTKDYMNETALHDLEDMRGAIKSIQSVLGPKGGVRVMAAFINALTWSDPGQSPGFHLEVVEDKSSTHPTGGDSK